MPNFNAGETSLLVRFDADNVTAVIQAQNSACEVGLSEIESFESHSLIGVENSPNHQLVLRSCLGFRTSYANNGPAAVPSRDATGADAATLNGWAPARVLPSMTPSDGSRMIQMTSVCPVSAPRDVSEFCERKQKVIRRKGCLRMRTPNMLLLTSWSVARGSARDSSRL